jgi:hypothetical protein
MRRRVKLFRIYLRWRRYRLSQAYWKGLDNFGSWLIKRGYLLRQRARAHSAPQAVVETRWDPISDEDRYDRPF